MRNTRQRELVLDIVNQSYNHPTAYEVYQNCILVIPNISLGTVYRNLNTLVELGSIQRVSVSGQVDRYDKITKHDHFVCVRCGSIIDIVKKNFCYEGMLEGNKVLDCKVRYDGICCDCINLEEGE